MKGLFAICQVNRLKTKNRLLIRIRDQMKKLSTFYMNLQGKLSALKSKHLKGVKVLKGKSKRVRLRTCITVNKRCSNATSTFTTLLTHRKFGKCAKTVKLCKKMCRTWRLELVYSRQSKTELKTVLNKCVKEQSTFYKQDTSNLSTNEAWRK